MSRQPWTWNTCRRCCTTLFLPICSSYCINFHNFINSFFKNYFILTIKNLKIMQITLQSIRIIFDFFSPDSTTSLPILILFILIQYTRKLDIDSTVYSLNTIHFCFDLKKIYLTLDNRFKRSINTQKTKECLKSLKKPLF